MQKLLMLNGASLDNKMTAACNTSIANSFVVSDEVKDNLLKFSQTVNIIKLHDKFNDTLPEKNNTNKIKI